MFILGMAMDGPINGQSPSCVKDWSAGSQQSSAGIFILFVEEIFTVMFDLRNMHYLFLADCRAGFQAPGSGNS